MQFETPRLILRPWLESDAEALYQYAKDPQVGPSAGWPVHTSVENSRETILHVLSAPETYAVIPKKVGHPVGSIGLMAGSSSGLSLPDGEAEIGYWIGVPFWGQGFIPEAVQAMLRHGFEALQLEKIWCGYFDGNIKSQRAQEKCGFTYHHTRKNVRWSLIDRTCDEHITCLTREAWQQLCRKPTQIFTERLVLRRHGMQYLRTTYAYTSDPENTRFMTHLPNRSLQECEAFLAEVDAEWQKPDPEFYEFAVLQNGEQIGGVGFNRMPQRDSVSLGWIVRKDHWGQGIIPEAARAVMDFAMNDLGIRRFIARCDAENVASARVMEKLGMRLIDRHGGRKNKTSDEAREELTYELKL